jgi:ABC-type transport system involved in multi-copper enzyme maturation permease subunit
MRVAIWTFVRLTLREASRNRLVALALGLTVVYIGLIAWAASKISQQARSAIEALTAGAAVEVMAFFFASFMLTLLAVFVAGHSTHQEAGSGLLQAIAAKPIRRFDILAGRWLGSALLLLVWVVIFTVGVVLAIGLGVGYYPPHPVPAAGLLLLESLAVLSLRMLFGTFLGTLASGIAPLLVYGLGWMGGMVEQAGKALNIPSLMTSGIITSLVIPTDTLWRGASYFLLPEIPIFGSPNGGGNPLVSLTPIAQPMLVWACLYVLLGFLAAARIFSRRDV